MDIAKDKLELILGRKEYQPRHDVKEFIMDNIRGSVLITGGAGSIGERMLYFMDILPHVSQIDVLDISEPTYEPPAPGWGYTNWFNHDITKPFDDKYSYHNIINLAGAKHAPEGEVDVRNAIDVNFNGVVNTMPLLAEGGFYVGASTCKSDNPETCYGATKLLAERYIKNNGGGVARYFNVCETQGNVFEIWNEQFKLGEPLSVMMAERYFISLDEAVWLTLLTVAQRQSGRTMIFKPNRKRYMPDVAKALYPGYPTTVTRLRRGDRESEPLLGTSERIEHPFLDTPVYKVYNYHDNHERYSIA